MANFFWHGAKQISLFVRERVKFYISDSLVSTMRVLCNNIPQDEYPILSIF